MIGALEIERVLQRLVRCSIVVTIAQVVVERQVASEVSLALVLFLKCSQTSK